MNTNSEHSYDNPFDAIPREDEAKVELDRMPHTDATNKDISQRLATYLDMRLRDKRRTVPEAAERLDLLSLTQYVASAITQSMTVRTLQNHSCWKS